MSRRMNKTDEIYRGYIRIKYMTRLNYAYNPGQTKVLETWFGPYRTAGAVKTQQKRFQNQHYHAMEPGSLVVEEEFVEVVENWRRV